MAVAFDAVGGGLANTNSPNTALTWTHTVASGTGVVVFLSLNIQVPAARGWTALPLAPAAVTYAGTSMTFLAAYANNNVATTTTGTAAGWTALYYIVNPASRGTQTLSVTTPNAPNLYLWGNSVSYTGVGLIGGPYFSSGSSASPSISIASVPDAMVMANVGIYNKAVTLASGTSRYSQSGTTNIESGFILDSTWGGSTPIALGATGGSAADWASIGVLLRPVQTGDAAATATATATAGITRTVTATANLAAVAKVSDPWQMQGFQGLFFLYDRNGLPYTPGTVSAGYGVAAATVATAAGTASPLKIANVGAAATATATFSASETRSVLAAASITAVATPDASGGRGQFLGASLSATGATGTPQPLYNAGAFSSLFVNSLFSATGLRTLIGQAALTSTAAAVANLTEFGIATASITATAARTGNLVSNQRIVDSGTIGTASASGDLSRGQNLDTAGVTATGARAGALSYGASAGANLLSTALFSGAIIKTRLLSGSLTVTATLAADMSENTVAQSSLTATATPAAALTKGLNAQAAIIVTAIPAAVAAAKKGMQAELTVVAYREGMIDEPREIIYVGADDRNSAVEPVDRRVSIQKYDRYAEVPPYSDRTAIVETTEVSQAISRDALQGFRGLFFWFVELPTIRSSSRSYPIGDDDRSVSVDAEDRDALVPATRPESLLK